MAPLLQGANRIRNEAVAKFESTYDVITRDIMTSASRNFARRYALLIATLVQNYRQIGKEVRKLRAKNLHFWPILALFWTKKTFFCPKIRKKLKIGIRAP